MLVYRLTFQSGVQLLLKGSLLIKLHGHNGMIALKQL